MRGRLRELVLVPAVVGAKLPKESLAGIGRNVSMSQEMLFS